MTDRVERLSPDDQSEMLTLLEQNVVVNLFLLGFVRTHALSRGRWYGAFEDGALTGIVLVIANRLTVPFCPDPVDAARIGEQLYHLHRPTLMVGPRAASDALWERWTRGRSPSRSFDQRLYVLQKAPEGSDPAGFRRASYEEWPVIADHSAAMELEDIGVDPSAADPALHDEVVRERVKSGRTWVIERDDDVLFQVNVGTSHEDGCQIGGTYVPPEHRGHGLATAGIAALSRRLLARHPAVTLHVNEANGSAVRVYERCGYQADAPFRLITP
ncbi:MAG: GNAT family N-acetyltransferase [Myxococcales bacterium]|nr:GNAT family N-acetyltransferase [Myxococcales bacterium]